MVHTGVLGAEAEAIWDSDATDAWEPRAGCDVFLSTRRASKARIIDWGVRGGEKW